MAVPLLLGACAGPTLHQRGAPLPSPPDRWMAAVPHGGDVDSLRRWWSHLDDPLLAALVADGQQVSADVATARASIADARAARQSARAALLPTLDAGASASRSRPEAGAPLVSSASTALSLQWELDVFGAQRAGARASDARWAASQLNWHDARVSVAAEVATTYVDLRACEVEAQTLSQVIVSRELTARLTALTAEVGTQSPVAAALASASAADERGALLRQQADCDRLVKSLVALTGREEAMLRQSLAEHTARLPRPAAFQVHAVPAQVLAQLPDVRAAEFDVLAASASADQARAQRWPRITLAGTVGAARSSSVGMSTDGSVWTLGPIAVTVPLFDGGTGRANAHAARERHAAALTIYAARLRAAVRDVENALLRLDSAARRAQDAALAVSSHEQVYRATAAGQSAGLHNLSDLEDARRAWLAARITRDQLDHDRVAAWIALYRAVGGGWSEQERPRAGATPP